MVNRSFIVVPAAGLFFAGLALAFYHLLWAPKYSDFTRLPENEKDRIVWEIYDRQEWGSIEQKPICRDLLANQGYYSNNYSSWTAGAIRLTERENWNEFAPLIADIYRNPKDIWLYRQSFEYLRAHEGRPIPQRIIDAAATLSASGNYQNDVTDEQFNSAVDIFRGEADKEIVLVYAVRAAATFGGKGGTDRGQKAAADILKTLSRDTVTRTLRLLCQNGQKTPWKDSSGVQWVADYLGIVL